MRLTWALLAFLEGTAAIDTYAAVAAKQNCSQPRVGCEGYYRALAISTSPPNSAFGPSSNVTGLSVAAIGAKATSSGTVVNAKIDVAGFRFKTPADVSDGSASNGLSFYFGYLGVNGNWDGSTQTKNAAGALAEVVSILSSINVYYDNDNTTGFKWDITQSDPQKRYNIFDCAAGERVGYDALDLNGVIDLKNLTWTPIEHTTVKCNTQAALANAPDSCEIHSLSTSGSLSGAAVITVTSRIASQPVRINGVLHGPEFVKFDLGVKFPWSSFSTKLYAPSRAKIAVISFNAGKSNTFVSQARRNGDSDSLVFSSGSGPSAHYAYTSTATVDGVTTSPVTTQIITGAQITDFQCTQPPCGPLSATFVASVQLKATVGWIAAFGWKSSITIHALGDKLQPLDIFWDPEVGTSDNSEVSSPNSAAFAAPSVVLLLALFLQ